MRLIVSSTARICALLALVAVSVCACSNNPSATKSTNKPGSSAHVLLVGNYHGVKGTYSTIQAAVSAARPGDWILIGPGDYHETADQSSLTSPELKEGGVAGVLITTPDIHLRGMNRNTVIVDGDKPGAPESCDPDAAWQNFGITSSGSSNPYGTTTSGTTKPYGRNGIVVFKTNDVSIENLTACNFLSGSGDSGNEIWWDGGDGSGQVGIQGYTGDYLTATSTYYGGESTAAAYGIFSSAGQLNQ